MWIILTPVYAPAPGGGGVYTKLLARALAGDGEDVLVITEAHPDREPIHIEPSVGPGRIEVHGMFPFRAGRAHRSSLSYVRYFWQNLCYLRVGLLARRKAIAWAAHDATWLVHTSLFYNPNLLASRIDTLHRNVVGKTYLIADVRDQECGPAHAPTLKKFDAIVGCSRKVCEQVRTLVPDGPQVVHIPVPYTPGPRPSAAEVTRVLHQYGLEGVRFILNANGVNEQKGYAELLDAVERVRNEADLSSVTLLTVGRARDWKPRDDTAVLRGSLRYLGPIPHEDVIALCIGAEITAAISAQEGLSRSVLEALSLGGNVLVPDLPEFNAAIPDQVVKDTDPIALAERMIQMLRNPMQYVPPRYPIENHWIEKLLIKYQDISRRYFDYN